MRSGLAAGVLGLAVFVAGPAAAAVPEGVLVDECVTDADCAVGLACRTRTWELCTAVVDTSGNVEEQCVEESAQVCSLKECTTDADCGGDTSCMVIVEDDCSEPREPRTGSGGGPVGLDREPCEPEVISVCVPPFLEPCEADADCGPGFLCMPDFECETTEEGDERCYDVWPGSCELVETPCTTDGQCGAGLVCEDVTELMCHGEESGGSGDEGGPIDPDGEREGTGGAGDEEGEWSEDECEELSLCLPPDLIAWAKAIGAAGDAGGAKGGDYESNQRGGSSGGGGSSGCSAGGAGLSLLGLLGVALLLRRR